MIKLEVVKKQGSTVLYFESRNDSSENLDELDEAYQALMGSTPKRGGYNGSNRFEIEVKDLA